MYSNISLFEAANVDARSSKVYCCFGNPNFLYESLERDISAIIDHLSVFMAIFVLQMCRNCYFQASNENSDNVQTTAWTAYSNNANR